MEACIFAGFKIALHAFDAYRKDLKWAGQTNPRALKLKRIYHSRWKLIFKDTESCILAGSKIALHTFDASLNKIQFMRQDPL